MLNPEERESEVEFGAIGGLSSDALVLHASAVAPEDGGGTAWSGRLAGFLLRRR